MKIGMLGSGSVGQTLAKGFAARNHDVVLGTGHPDEHRDLEPAVRVADFATAAKHGDAVVLAVSWSAVAAVIAAATPEALSGKLVIDTTNPLRFGPNGLLGLDAPPEGSAGQFVAARLPDARVVKAFNVVGAPLMVAPNLPGGPPDMFICGDDASAKETVATLCAELAYPAFDVGGLDRSGLLESLAMLWISLTMTGRAHDHAFKLLRPE